MSAIFDRYVELRIAHAGAVEWMALDEARLLAARLDDMLAEHPHLDEAFREFYERCAALSSVATSDDDMARKIRKHFSGKRADN